MAKSVLVVEDEPNIVLSLEYVIKKAGYEVRAFTARGTRRMKSFTSRLKLAVWDRTATSLARRVVFTCA